MHLEVCICLKIHPGCLSEKGKCMYSIQFSPIFPTLSTFFPYISLLLHKSWHRNATRINNGEYSRLSNNRTCMFCRLSRANKNLEHLNCRLAILHQLNNIKLFFIACHTKGSFTFFDKCCTLIRYSRVEQRVGENLVEEIFMWCETWVH